MVVFLVGFEENLRYIGGKKQTREAMEMEKEREFQAGEEKRRGAKVCSEWPPVCVNQKPDRTDDIKVFCSLLFFFPLPPRIVVLFLYRVSLTLPTTLLLPCLDFAIFFFF